jgi:hypothetical protein
MTDSNKGKELDDLKNEENEDLDDRAKTAEENNSTLMAGLPKPDPRPSLYIVPGSGGSRLNVIPGGKLTPSTTPKPSSTPSQGPLGSPTPNPLNNPLINSEPGTLFLLWQQKDFIRGFLKNPQNNNPATPQVPTARSSNLGNNLLRSIDKNIQQSTPSSTPATPMGPPRYNPNENPGRTYEGPVLPDHFKDVFKNKPKPAEEKKQKPGGSPQREPGGRRKKLRQRKNLLTTINFIKERHRQNSPGQKTQKHQGSQVSGAIHLLRRKTQRREEHQPIEQANQANLRSKTG